MQINHNISAMIANGHLKKTNNLLDKSIERLSSGFRINHAADDAAGMAISQKMKTQIAGLEQASRNASDGISVIQTAEGALGEVESILQRGRELAVQSANGTYTEEDREAIQKEIDQLMEEVDRISSDTEFNTKSLLNGNVSRKSYTNNTKVSLVSVSDAVASNEYKFQVTQAGESAKIEGTPIQAPAAPIAANEAGSIVINGEKIEVNEGDSVDVVVEKIRDTCDRLNITLTRAGDKLTFETVEAGANKKIEIYCDPEAALAAKLGLTGKTGKANAEVGKDAVVVPATGGNFSTTCTIIADGNNVKITDSDGFEMRIQLDKTVDLNQDITIAVLEAGPMILQIGANEGQTVSLDIPEVSTRTLELSYLNLQTQDEASDGITMLDDAINMVSSVRAKLGAYQNRLEHAVANLDTSAENLTEALSRIEDTDMAEEMANYTQKNVLAQAGVSMVSQANERPQNVLSLLQ